MDPSHEPSAAPEHISGLGMYTWTLGVLLVLTAATVGVAQLELGRWGLPVALAIAFVKAALVVLLFMHLRWDAPVLRAALTLALLLVGVAYGLSFLDWGLRPHPTGGRQQSSRLLERGLR